MNRDPEYLAAHSSTTRKLSPPGWFINQVELELGGVQSVGPFGAILETRFVPYYLQLRGTVKTRVVFAATPAWVSIDISGSQSDWKIDHFRWDY